MASAGSAVAEERARIRVPSRRPVILIAGGGTGGHLMPALAIAETLRAAAPDIEPVLVGATRGVEARVLRTRDFRYHLLPAEPIYRRTWWKNVRWPLIAGRLLGSVGRVYALERPVAVLGTGGYASGPVVWVARGRGVPSAVQEQNAYPGLATRWLARRVNHVYLGLPEARKLLKPGSAGSRWTDAVRSCSSPAAARARSPSTGRWPTGSGRAGREAPRSSG